MKTLWAGACFVVAAAVGVALYRQGHGIPFVLLFVVFWCFVGVSIFIPPRTDE